MPSEPVNTNDTIESGQAPSANDVTGPEDKQNAKRVPSDLMKASIIKSALLHGAIVAALLVSFNFSSKPLVFASQSPNSPQTKVDVVNATFIDSNVLAEKKREKAQAEAAAVKRQKQAERRKQEQKQEQERLRKKRADEARKKQQEAQEKEAQKQEQERVNALEREQQKEKQIAEQRAKEQALQQALAQEMKEQLEQEQATMQAAQQRRVMSELEKYQSLIMQTIVRGLNSDGGFKDKACTLNVKLARNGLVTEVRAMSGDDALCREARNAVLRPDTLPVSPDPLVYEKMKNLNIIVRDLK